MILVYAALALAGCGSEAPKQAEVPKKSKAGEPMPDVWRVRFETTQGPFVVEVRKEWAPKGAERFWKLVTTGFFDDSRFYRVRPDFIAQFGIAGDPNFTAMMNSSTVEDDPVKEKNVKGTISFAQAGKNTRRTQVFVNLKNNPELDRTGFVPFGKVVEGMDVFDKLYVGYGEWSPPGRGPESSRMQTEGNKYLDAKFPRLDKLKRAIVVE